MTRFRLENRREKVATMRDFLLRLSRYALFAIALILISVTAGTFGYHFIGELKWIDSFHMACMILTGMGPTTEMKTDAAKIFSSFFALYSGVAFLSITAIFLAPIVHRFLHILHVEADDDDSEK